MICPICKTEVNSNHFYIHAKRYLYKGIVFYECPLCGFYFSNLSVHMNAHIKNRIAVKYAIMFRNGQIRDFRRVPKTCRAYVKSMIRRYEKIKKEGKLLSEESVV
ncbi:hypothetical protein [Sulfolobus ellipsoid virus 1]|uniref:C2H2-type domain-containing protein n=1 Tax=Sulfolobus ellipsoid virus 1 TaxID=2056194 RepID=A0A2H4RBQ5_9VIRU|nr:hypothetical protein FGG62_gp32 [Sulfolobus ellipsoid virus 1]ATY46510.1 hypothetical protein [Sulfolobus ellipsoid virus 1]